MLEDPLLMAMNPSLVASFLAKSSVMVVGGLTQSLGSSVKVGLMPSGDRSCSAFAFNSGKSAINSLLLLPSMEKRSSLSASCPDFRLLLLFSSSFLIDYGGDDKPFSPVVTI